MFTALISRPVAALLIAGCILYAGFSAYILLPRSSMPTVELPVFVVSTEIGGADAETVMQSVTNPLVHELLRIPAVDTIEATNEQGRSTIRVAIEEGEDLNDVADDLRLALTIAAARLPSGLKQPPAIRRLNPMAIPVLEIALTGTNRSIGELERFAVNFMLPRIGSIEGVREIAGLEPYRPAVRIVLDPAALTARQVTISDVEASLRAAASGGSVGTIESAGIATPIGVASGPKALADFASLPVFGGSGPPVPLGDLGRASTSTKDARHLASYNGRHAIMMAVHAREDADMAVVARSIRSTISDMTDVLPEGMRVDIVRDRSAVVEEAIGEVEWTFAATVGLMVILLFAVTGNLGAAIIPSLILPLSLSLTIVGFWLFGLTINNITLIALTLSVGLVVDDAIVVHENIVRHFESGLTPLAAARRGVSEVGFTVLAMTGSLAVAFVPMLLLDGVLGQIMQSFAITLILALSASAVTSLLFSPMGAALWLARKGSRHPRESWTWFGSLTALYGRSLARSLRRPSLMFICAVATLVAVVWLLADLPRSFLPETDDGHVVITIEARPDVSTTGMLEEQARAARVISTSRYVRNLLFERGSAGMSDHVGIFQVELKPRSERPGLQSIMDELQRDLAAIPSIESTVTSAQAARHGREQRSRYWVAVTANTPDQLRHWSERLHGAMAKERVFGYVTTTLGASVTRHDLQVSALKADHMGIDPSAARRAMTAAFSGNEVATAYIDGRAHGVHISLDVDHGIARWFDLLHERNTFGQPVPYSAFIDVEAVQKPLRIEQVGLRPSADIFFDPQENTPLDEAIGQLDALIVSLALPPDVTVEMGGDARDFRRMQSSQTFLIVASIAAMFVILAVLYESVSYPLIILAGLPSAALGGVLALLIWQMPLSVMALIGLLVVIGIVKKNAIMMIDFALAEKQAGAGSREAIQRAAVQRFRPIMLTTVAALAAALPIAVGWGSGGELRQPLGIVIAGGLILSQVVTLYITPSLFILLSSRASKICDNNPEEAGA